MNKPKNLSTTVSDTCQSIDSKWDEAISDTQDELRFLSIRVARLQQAISVFRANKRDGIPWPEKRKS
jgi:hypothetical protein